MSSITTWTRLEPQSRTASIDQGLQAKVHDPLWLLARQWQFGEFQAEDAGTPVSARLRGELAPIARYHAGALGNTAVTGQPYQGQVPLETLVEAEPLTQAFHPGRAIEAGLHFFRLLKVHGVGQYRDAYQTQYPLPEVTTAAYGDRDSQRYLRVMSGRAINGYQLYADLVQALRPPTGSGDLPGEPDIPAGDRAAVQAAAEAWLSWYIERFDEPQPDRDAWIPERMEHTFAVSVPTQDGETVYVAHEYHGGHLDWYHFNQNQRIGLGGKVDDTAATPIVRTVMPGPISFQGMPEARWWTFEDAELNLSTLSAGPEDLGRMLLLQYALTYSDDWFVIPVEMDVGRLLLHSLVVTDTFGVRTLIRSFSEADQTTGAWRMFTHTLEDSEALPPGNQLFLPPVLTTSLHSSAIEEIHLLRDEMANMAWAVEAKVENARGQSQNRHETALIQRAAVAAPDDSQVDSASASTFPEEADLVYTLMTDVPAHWIPLVPVKDATSSSLRLRRGRMLMYQGEQLVDLPAWGRLLTPNLPLELAEEEVGSEGAQVTRRYQYTRWLNGSIHLWMGRQKQVGRGEGWSGLRFDVVESNPNLPIEPEPVTPMLTMLSPISGRQGDTLMLSITGRGLTGTTEISLSGSGVTIETLTVIHDRLVEVELAIASSATVGQRSLLVTTPSAVLDSQDFELTFQIQSAPSSPSPSPPPIYPPPGSTGHSAIGGTLL